jgi:hypothetical protein
LIRPRFLANRVAAVVFAQNAVVFVLILNTRLLGLPHSLSWHGRSDAAHRVRASGSTSAVAENRRVRQRPLA